MIDISPEILEKLTEEFSDSFYKDQKVKQIYKKISEGRADYRDIYELSRLLGISLTETLEKVYYGFHKLGKLPNDTLYQNIVEKTLAPMLEEGNSIIAEAASIVQNDLNRIAGTGIKAVTPPISKEKMKGLAIEVTNARSTKNTKTAAREQILNYAMATVDNFISSNMEFLKDSGLTPKITRMRGSNMNSSCDYCAQLVYSGPYEGPNMPEEIFRRHKGCRCIVLYDPGDGSGIQGVHSKKEYRDYSDAIKHEREYLTKLDKMSPKERKKVRNAKTREGARNQERNVLKEPKTFKGIDVSSKDDRIKPQSTNEKEQRLHPINPVTKKAYQYKPVVIEDKQFGRKIGTHAQDFNRSPANAEDRRVHNDTKRRSKQCEG